MSDVYRTRAIQMETRYIEIKAKYDEKCRQLQMRENDMQMREKEITYLRQQLLTFEATKKTMNSLAEENDQLLSEYTELQTTLGDVMGILDNFENLEQELDETKKQLQNAILLIQEKERLNIDLEIANRELGEMCETLIQQAEELQPTEGLGDMKEVFSRSRQPSTCTPGTPRSKAEIKKTLTEGNFNLEALMEEETMEAGQVDEEGFPTFRRGRANTRELANKLQTSTSQFENIIRRSQKKKLERQATMSALSTRLQKHKITE